MKFSCFRVLPYLHKHMDINSAPGKVLTVDSRAKKPGGKVVDLRDLADGNSSSVKTCFPSAVAHQRHTTFLAFDGIPSRCSYSIASNSGEING